MRQQFNFYSTSSYPLLKSYMETMINEWEEYKDFTEEQVRAMDLKKYKTYSLQGGGPISNPWIL